MFILQSLAGCVLTGTMAVLYARYRRSYHLLWSLGWLAVLLHGTIFEWLGSGGRPFGTAVLLCAGIVGSLFFLAGGMAFLRMAWVFWLYPAVVAVCSVVWIYLAVYPLGVEPWAWWGVRVVVGGALLVNGLCFLFHRREHPGAEVAWMVGGSILGAGFVVLSGFLNGPTVGSLWAGPLGMVSRTTHRQSKLPSTPSDQMAVRSISPPVSIYSTHS